MRWLHLSDIHVGQPDQARSNAMQLLIQAISDHAGTEPLDLVLLTGDIAFSGQASEYQSFKDELLDPLQELDIAKHAHVVAVPGNHDLDCDCSHPHRVGHARTTPSREILGYGRERSVTSRRSCRRLQLFRFILGP